MAKPFKIVNNPGDTGDADHYGGVDIDNIASFLNAQSDFHNYSYLIYKESTTYKTKNGSTGVIDYSSTSFHTVLQNIMNASSNNAFLDIVIGAGIFDITGQVLAFENGKGNNTRIRGLGDQVTIIRRSAGFPDSNMFEFDGKLDATINYALAANAAAGTDFVTVTSGQAANFAIGDRVKLKY